MAEATAQPKPPRRQRRAAAKSNPVQAEQETAQYVLAAQALKDLGQDSEEQLKELAEKCGLAGPVEVYSWQPYGGAKSFADYDQYRQSSQMSMEYDELNWTLQQLMNNVLADSTLTDAAKGAAITALAGDFTKRADAIRKGGGKSAEIAGKEVTASKSIDAGGFTAFKSDDGSWRWLAIFSNRYYDKAGEVFPESAHREFEGWVDRTKEFPELWDWHVPLVMGKADVITYSDGFMIAGGYFNPDSYQEAARLAAKEDLGVSHGYRYDGSTDPGPDGAYSRYRTFEISPLPRAKAANELTLFLPDGRVKEDSIMLTAEKRAHLVGIHGEEKVKDLESRLSTMSKDLEGSGIGWKEFADALTNTPSAGAPAAAGSGVPTVPPAAAPAPDPAGGSKEEGMKALETMITTAVKAVMDPFEARLAKLEKGMDAAIAEVFTPPAAAAIARVPASQDPNTIINGNSTSVREAKEGAKAVEGALDGVPEYLKFYMTPQAVAGAVAAAAAPAAS